MIGVYYFINAFREVSEIPANCDTTNELRKANNLFDTREQAELVNSILERQIKKTLSKLRQIRNDSRNNKSDKASHRIG